MGKEGTSMRRKDENGREEWEEEKGKYGNTDNFPST